MQLDLGQQMSFQIHIQGAYQLTDVRVAKTVGFQFSSSAFQWTLGCLALFLDLILPTLVSQKDYSKRGSWGTYETTKDAQTVIQQQTLELTADYILLGIFPDWKTVPMLPPFIQQTCNIFAVIRFFFGVPPWRIPLMTQVPLNSNWRGTYKQHDLQWHWN